MSPSAPDEAKTSHPLDAHFSHVSIRYHDTLPFVTVVALHRPKKRNSINAQVCYKSYSFMMEGYYSYAQHCAVYLILFLVFDLNRKIDVERNWSFIPTNRYNR